MVVRRNPYADELEEDSPPLVETAAGLPVPADAAAMPEEFSRSTMLALKAQQHILEMRLDPMDDHYEAELRAKAQLASAQINAQLKADEQKLKRAIAEVSYYKELKAALEAFYEARRNKE